MDNKLKPCPFCGSSAKIIDRDVENWGAIAVVMCVNCEAEMHGDRDTDASAAWNQRAK